MSHYAVAVFLDPNGKNLEELLAPFDEGLHVPHYIPKADIIAKVRSEIETFKNGAYAEYLKNPKAYIEKHSDNQRHIEYISKEFPMKLHWTDEDCYLDGIRYYEEENIKPDGSVFSDYNPNSKWDWYDIGGRFSDIIPLKEGGYANEASMCDVDIDHRDEEEYKNAIRFWQLYVEGQEPVTEEDKELLKFVWYKKEYFTERYANAEEYAAWVSGFTFYAALLPTGEWLEPGRMGWWGMSHATADDDKTWHSKVKEILKQAQDNNWEITIVDCHI